MILRDTGIQAGPMARLDGIKAVAFDVYGTLVEIGDIRAPFRQLLELGCAQGRTCSAQDGIELMSSPFDLRSAAEQFGIAVPSPQLERIESDLRAELASIRLFADAIPTLAALRAAGVRIGLCSNLAAPYAPPIRSLLPLEPDAIAWSFEAGACKPDPAIYRYLCQALGCAPGEVLMIGDTRDADYDGPRAFGMPALRLVRSGAGTGDTVSSLLELLD
jgi:HAD superfamily hydrolase (TIGR01549 family)